MMTALLAIFVKLENVPLYPAVSQITNVDHQKYAKMANVVTAAEVTVTAISLRPVSTNHVKTHALLKYVALTLNVFQSITRVFVAVLKAIPEIQLNHVKSNKKNVMSIMIAALPRFVSAIDALLDVELTLTVHSISHVLTEDVLIHVLYSPRADSMLFAKESIINLSARVRLTSRATLKSIALRKNKALNMNAKKTVIARLERFANTTIAFHFRNNAIVTLLVILEKYVTMETV